MSLVRLWTRFVRVTVTPETRPSSPDASMIDGYGVASALSLIVIGEAFVNVVALAEAGASKASAQNDQAKRLITRRYSTSVARPPRARPTNPVLGIGRK